MPTVLQRQNMGLGRRLLAFAEAEALRLGYREIRLYTHQTIIENQRLYAAIGLPGNRTRDRGWLRSRLYAQAIERRFIEHHPGS